MPLWAVLTLAARGVTTCPVASRMRVSNSSLATLPPFVVCIGQFRYKNIRIACSIYIIYLLHCDPSQAPLARAGNASLKLKEAEGGVCLEPLEEVTLEDEYSFDSSRVK